MRKELNRIDAANPSKDSETPAAEAVRGKRPRETEEKVPMTFGFSADFAKRLKIVTSAGVESSSEYVESRLVKQVQQDIRKLMEELTG